MVSDVAICMYEIAFSGMPVSASISSTFCTFDMAGSVVSAPSGEANINGAIRKNREPVDFFRLERVENDLF